MNACIHIEQIRDVAPRTPDGCEDCLQTQHPIIQSFEPDEDWGWCYVDDLLLDPAPLRAVLR